MTPLDPPDDLRDRIETLRAELTAEHAGDYATVETDDVLAYLLDLADAVDDPDRLADPTALSGGADSASRSGDADGSGDANRADDAEPAASDADTDGLPFEETAVRARLERRNRKHGDPDDADRMDLYSVAAALDVSGRSDMTKDELVTAILEAAARRARDPFADVDVDVGPVADETGEADAADDEEAGAETEADAEDGSSQLDAAMSLLDTHGDKWTDGDGDARYEVELPDGSVETARTKADVRAVLFKNY